MILSLIVALSENNAIGVNNGLPWHLPDDLKFFKKNTLNKPIVMGRKTFDSLGKPLPNRLNIVISFNADLNLPDGVLLFNNIESVMQYLESKKTEEAFIIGGGMMFEKCLNMVDRLYITRVHASFNDADTYFNNLNTDEFRLLWNEKHQEDEKHKFSFTFQIFDKIK